MAVSFNGHNNNDLTSLQAHGAFNANGGSFITNHYVIYKPGVLSGNSNWLAYEQGITQLDRALFIRSTDVRSSFELFCSYLERVAERQRKVEEAFIQMQLGRLRAANAAQQDIFGLTQKEANILANALEQALATQRYNEAFTLFLNYQQTYTALLHDISAEKNEVVGRITSTHDERFSEWVAKKLADTRVAAEIEEALYNNPSKVLDDVVAQYFNKMAGLDNIDQLGKVGLQTTYDSLRLAISKRLMEYSLPPLEKVDVKDIKIEKTRDAQKKLFHTPKGRQRTSVGTLIRTLLIGIGNGIGTELKDIGAARRTGGAGINVGGLLKEVQKATDGQNAVVKQRTDNLFIYTTAAVDYDTTAITEYFSSHALRSIDDLKQAISDLHSIIGAENMFELHLSDKEYLSRHPLKVVDTTKFGNLQPQLEQMAFASASKGWSTNATDGNYFDKLIFLLVNTTQGAIAENMIDRIALNIASVCALWVWEDFTETMDYEGILKEINNRSTNCIHLFNQGGAYFSASQLIQKVVNDLRANTHLSGASSFVNVDIHPSTTYPSLSEYNEWLHDPSNEFYNQPENDDAAWQATLQTRWVHVREQVLRQGDISIHFDQVKLNKLLSQLGIILTQAGA